MFRLAAVCSLLWLSACPWPLVPPPDGGTGGGLTGGGSGGSGGGSATGGGAGGGSVNCQCPWPQRCGAVDAGPDGGTCGLKRLTLLAETTMPISTTTEPGRPGVGSDGTQWLVVSCVKQGSGTDGW